MESFERGILYGLLIITAFVCIRVIVLGVDDINTHRAIQSIHERINDTRSVLVQYVHEDDSICEEFEYNGIKDFNCIQVDELLHALANNIKVKWNEGSPAIEPHKEITIK